VNFELPLMETLPSPERVRDRLGDALREVELLRGLLKLSEKAQEYRDCDQQIDGDGGGDDRAA
jgi:hypothetical protein